MEDIEDRTKATSHEFQMGRSKEECQSEVRDLLEKLSSWREQSNRQFSNIIDSHTSSINKGINDLSEEVCDLRTKLSVITQERNNLLQNVKKLSGENKKLKDVIHIVQPLPNPEVESQNNQEGLSASHENVDQELDQEHLDNSENADSTEGNLNDSTFIEIKHEGVDEEVTDERDIDCHQEWSMMSLPLGDHICSKCNEVFSTRRSLRIHITNVHSKLDLSEVMRGQTKEQRDQGNRSKSEALVIKENKTSRLQVKSGAHDKQKCELCSSQVVNLKRHIKAVHDNIRDHICKDCGHAFSDKGNFTKHLSKHEKSVHKIRDKKIKRKQQKCDHCSSEVVDLKRHIKSVHDNIRDHICNRCGHAFSDKGNFAKHLKKHKNSFTK